MLAAVEECAISGMVFGKSDASPSVADKTNLLVGRSTRAGSTVPLKPDILKQPFSSPDLLHLLVIGELPAGMFVRIARLLVSDHRGYMNMYTALRSSPPHNIT